MVRFLSDPSYEDNHLLLVGVPTQSQNSCAERETPAKTNSLSLFLCKGQQTGGYSAWLKRWVECGSDGRWEVVSERGRVEWVFSFPTVRCLGGFQEEVSSTQLLLGVECSGEARAGPWNPCPGTGYFRSSRPKFLCPWKSAGVFLPLKSPWDLSICRNIFKPSLSFVSHLWSSVGKRSEQASLPIAQWLVGSAGLAGGEEWVRAGSRGSAGKRESGGSCVCVEL